MTPSANFYGYEDRTNNAAIVLVPLPPAAYAELERTINPNSVKKQGLLLESRAPMTLPAGKAFLVIGRQQIENTWIRKLILVASLPMVTALITDADPRGRQGPLPDDAIRTALQAWVRLTASGRRTARATAVQSQRACRLSGRRSDARPRHHAGR